ncbi:Protein of unknown function [Bacillus wiedmannii]|uniref:Uncharacterized protein n=1 Tax=Bacillus wiedmannii TaxID=1890302 RepID=A0AB37YZU8_9BACI|nr:Protein of unknown function [Bacillus wiedmannii]
MMDTSLHQSD